MWMIILKPSFQDLLNKPAIVIIDEIDAHLHPSWQQKTVHILRNTFPNIQFIITAHSPLVVSGCHANEVSVLRKDRDSGRFVIKQFERDFVNVKSSELYEVVFNVEEIDEYYKSIAGLVNDSGLEMVTEEIKRLKNAEASQTHQLDPSEAKQIEELYKKDFYIRKFIKDDE